MRTFENEIPHISFKMSLSHILEKENLIFKCTFNKKSGLWMVVVKWWKSTLLPLNGIIRPKNGVIHSSANIGMVFQILIIRY